MPPLSGSVLEGLWTILCRVVGERVITKENITAGRTDTNTSPPVPGLLTEVFLLTPNIGSRSPLPVRET